jgi:hypothetical protein
LDATVIARLMVVVAGQDPPPVTGEQGRELARRELEKQVYHRNDPSAIDRFLQRLREWLDSLNHTAHDPQGAASHGSGGGILGLVLILAAILAIAALGLWWMRRHRNARSAREALLQKPSSAAEHRTAAERLAAEGRWAEAIRERLRGIARDLEERAILEPRPGRTADELAAEAAPALPEHAAGLVQGVRIFDDVWYGGRPGTQEGYTFLTSLEEQVRRAKPRPIAEPAEPAGFGRPQ